MLYASEWMARVAVILLALAAVVVVGFAVIANRRVVESTRDAIVDSASNLPVHDVGLVLAAQADAPQWVSRVDAGAVLFKAGKVKHLLVSGDSGTTGYGEPNAIKEELVRLGVPAECITSDPGGYGILDSLIRAKNVFEVNALTIIVQRVHCPRALFIARTLSMDAVAFAVAETDAPFAWRHEASEVFFRTVAVVDMFAFRRRSRFFGKPQPIIIRPTGLDPHGAAGVPATAAPPASGP